MQLVFKTFNLHDTDPPTSQTDSIAMTAQ